MRRRSARLGAAVVAVLACGLAAGCTVAGAPAATGSPEGAGLPAGRLFVYVTGKAGTNEISQYASPGSGALRPLTPKNVASGEFPYDIAVSPPGTSATPSGQPTVAVRPASPRCESGLPPISHLLPVHAHARRTILARADRRRPRVFDPPYAYVITSESWLRSTARAGGTAELRRAGDPGVGFTAAQMRSCARNWKARGLHAPAGIARFPSPVLSPAAASQLGAAVNSGSAQFAAAQQACGLEHLVRQERNPARQE